VRGVPSRSNIWELDCVNCGTYRITRNVQSWVTTDPTLSTERYRLSHLTRLASDAGKVLELAGDAVKDLLAGAPRHPTLPELMDRLLLDAVDSTAAFDQAVAFPLCDYPLYVLRSAGEMTTGLYALVAEGLLDKHSGTNFDVATVAATPAGWRAARELRASAPRGDQAFVAMSFSAELAQVFGGGIAPALRACGYRAYRVDREHFLGKIDDKIIAELRRSALVVADFTEHRAGVYFEAGYGWALGLPVISTCREDQITSSHFDYRQYNHILWTTPDELREKLRDRIRATLPLRSPLPDPARS
jgi:hypothetical protein